MLDQDILYSFANYINEKNPTSLQVCFEMKNFVTGANVGENEEYINITQGLRQDVLDSVGESYVLKELDCVATLKYDKTGIFNIVQNKFQNFIEGVESKLGGQFYTYKFNEISNTYEKSTEILKIDYTRVDSPIILYNDDNTKTMFWIVPIKHSN